MAEQAVLEQHVGLQLSGAQISWSSLVSVALEYVPGLVRGRNAAPAVAVRTGLRSMYAQLARDYDALPRVPDLGGGLPGEVHPI